MAGVCAPPPSAGSPTPLKDLRERSSMPGQANIKTCFYPVQACTIALPSIVPPSPCPPMPKTHAVLTGDLVSSGERTPDLVDEAMRALRTAARELQAWTGHDTHFSRFRGDGWQLYLASPAPSLAAVLLLMASLRTRRTGLETRIALGIGPIERLGRARKGLADAAGEAFTLSGRALDAMPRHRRIALAGPGVVLPWHVALFELATWTAGRWTPEQAEAVALALGPQARRTQAEIAEVLGVTRQAVQSRLSGAGWDALSRSVEAVQSHDWGVTNPGGASHG